MRMKSKVDVVMYMVFLSTIVMTIIPIWLEPYSIVAYVVTVPFLFFFVDILLTTDYSIQGETLVVRCGHLIKWCVPIMKIHTIHSTRTLLSAPALSVDRIALQFGKYDEIVISPRHKEAFVKALQAVNADIRYERR